MNISADSPSPLTEPPVGTNPYNPSPVVWGMLVFCIWVLTFPGIGRYGSVGIDESFQYAFNYFFVNRVQLGSEILFTFGPLGFLMFPQAMGANLYIASVVIGLLRLVFIGSLVYLGRLRQGTGRKQLLWLGAIAMVCAFLLDLNFLSVFLTPLLLLLHRETGKTPWLAGAVFNTALALLIKCSMGITSGLILFSYLVLQIVQTRSFKPALGAVGFLALLFLGFWGAYYGNLNGLAEYFTATWHFSSGNSSAMSINPANNWLLLGGFIGLYALIPVLTKASALRFFYALFLLPTLAFWKYGFAREHHHIAALFVYFIFFFLLLLVYHRAVTLKLVGLITAALVVFYANMAVVNVPFLSDKNGLGLVFTNMFLLELPHTHREFARISREKIAVQRLPVSWRREIGSQSVDFYPFETSYAPANGLNWTPRPVFQSYITYTPYLDGRNAVFYQGPKAPDYILWDKTETPILYGLDDRYLLNDEPLTMGVIARRYRPVMSDDRRVLLKRTDNKPWTEPVIVGETESRWGEWIPLPTADSAGIVRARLTAHRSLVGSLMRLIYKEPEFYVEYRTSDKKLYRHRLVIDNAVTGVWASPYVKRDDLNRFPEAGQAVSALRFDLGKNRFFSPDIQVMWERLDI